MFLHESEIWHVEFAGGCSCLTGGCLFPIGWCSCPTDGWSFSNKGSAIMGRT